MTGPSIEQPATVAPAGTVFDIGYQNYTGPREGRSRSRLAVYKDGVRAALGLGRGARAKVLPWLFIVVLVSIALVMALVAGAADRLAGPGAAEQLNLPSHSDYYGIASMIFLVFAAVGAPELLCRDRREGVINLYLVRPLTGSDYVIARWVAFFTVTVAVAWLPQIILWLGLTLGDPQPGAYASEHWADVPKFLAAGVALAAYTTTFALLTAAFTTRAAYASVFLVGLFLIAAPFVGALATEIEGPAGRWVSLFNLSNIPVHVNDLIFGDVSVVTEEAPASGLRGRTLVGWYFLWTLVPAAILWLRYRRLTP